MGPAPHRSRLHRPAPARSHVLEVLPSTEPIGPAGSSLPRLAADHPVRLLLLEPTGSAVDMAAQISAAADYFHADTLALIDVGETCSPTAPTPDCTALSQTSSPSPPASAPDSQPTPQIDRLTALGR